jgi:hypothetical protein
MFATTWFGTLQVDIRIRTLYNIVYKKWREKSRAMPNCIYYISWFTWLEEDANTNWDFWYLKQGSRLKPRKTSDQSHIDADEVADAFTGAQAAKLDSLDANFINDVKLLAFVEAESDQEAKDQILAVFPDAEFDKCEQIDTDTRNQIIAMINRTLARAGADQEKT